MLHLRTALVLALAALAVAGCGRRGALQPPPEAGAASGPPAAAPTAGPVGAQQAPAVEPAGGSFPLDPLI